MHFGSIGVLWHPNSTMVFVGVIWDRLQFYDVYFELPEFKVENFLLSERS